MSLSGRREFLIVVVALLALPGSARAQGARARKPYRIGLLPGRDQGTVFMIGRFATGGWQEERDYVLIDSGAAFGAPMELGVRRLLDEKVDLILVNTTAHARAVQQANTEIPVVMWSSGYPVEAGVALSLARPGKNVTGMTAYAGTGIWGKHLELLREVRPSIRRVGVLWGYLPPGFPRQEVEPCYAELHRAAERLGLELRISEVASPEYLPSALAAVDAQASEALLLTTGPALWNARERVMNYAVRKRLPTITDFPWPFDDKLRPLLHYGAFVPALMDQALRYMIQILEQGAKPGDLPIQQPRDFGMVVDLRAARAIGIEVPRSILLRATRVVE